MPRKARLLKEGCSYYVESKSHDNLQIFRTIQDYQFYMDLLTRYKDQLDTKIYAFCIFPRTTHLIVHPQQVKNLSIFMQKVNQVYASYFNGQQKRQGTVWRDRFRSHVLSNEKEIINLTKLIEFLPVHFNLAASPMNYPWSSYSQRVFGTRGLLDLLLIEENLNLNTV